ncbi:SGNH/GDSL hydrolase family protein [Streptomyces poriferorum]|uniref:SGNH/GDSL hydrolase family protein n=1 Tax=Streptomyces poriferorum TaxID=2798799 RepID=A0ABY9IVH7_9ACTN|nr:MULTISPECIES: SGNH/GDSL hydrolase family protein [Streptomyces]MBW5253318.1 SGNH/GDSL hydrolase family protein [Streptomyces poriferorum]MBW5261373.1 SGNH/GDSL hydrolase family protein [Streptomyces poriferorum]MDP5312184.1 SGNH/GDSL hydrolase family protein [Streptomyces sp. Alt4]WLQ48558.1 SGNH/GDSL hydrolase family protein [Streptomyces sp. Alt1]WLQ58764.1 SGNH/GDSL hydrolase family protein [Streptomyces sp. Alt2]
MPRRQGSALLIALLVGTAALAALVAFTGSLLFTEPRAKAVAAAGPQGVARTPAAPARSTGQWLATWAAAPVLGATDPEQGPDPSLRTIRNVVHTSIGGDAARITLSNLFGTQPLLVDHVTVNALPVTFRNAPSVTIAAGGQVISDPVVAPVAADADLVVTLRTPTARGPVTVHPNSHQTSSTEGPQGTRPTTDWRYLTAVDVRGMAATGTLVAFGDSLTAGSGSTTDANSRWPDILADRLAGRYAVVNQGIGGNRILLNDVGPRALDRFDRDVLAVTGVKTVVIALGINDIQAFPQESDPARITDALRTLTERAHARGLRVIGATLMPYEGQGNWTPARNAVREHVNTMIRAGGVFDEFLDFDLAARDPSRPTRLLPAYDSGDHLHLNDAGYQRLGSLVDVASLLRAQPSSDAL